MGVVDAPQWLLPAFVRSAKAVGAQAPLEQLREAGERLVTMWTSTDRCFHNLKHAIDMLARVDELADESHNPDAMRLAVWYHGCVFSSAHEQAYRRNGGEDEIASAAYAAQDLQSLGVPDKVTDRICALILNLKRHNLPSDDIDAQALNDADLGALAVGPQQYKRYREQVRAEYAHIPLPDYLRARLAIVSRLLERDTLFHSPLGERWELPARQNLQAEMRRLSEELAQAEIADAAAGQGATPRPPASSASLGGEATPPLAMPPTTGAPLSAGSALSAEPAPPRAPEPASSSTAEDVGQAGARAATPSSGVTRVSVLRPRPSTGTVPRVSVMSARRPAADRPERSERGAASDAVPATTGEGAADKEDLSHTTTLESCAEDIDRLLATPRAAAPAAAAPTAGSASLAPVTGETPVVDRRSIAQAERTRMAERARQRAEEAKVAREARTGEFSAISAPIVEDGAGQL